jgi:hypothetical protein
VPGLGQKEEGDGVVWLYASGERPGAGSLSLVKKQRAGKHGVLPAGWEIGVV